MTGMVPVPKPGAGGGGPGVDTDDQTAAEVPFPNVIAATGAGIDFDGPADLDLTGAPIEFDIAIDGGVPVSVVLDEDYADDEALRADLAAQLAGEGAVVELGDGGGFVILSPTTGSSSFVVTSTPNAAAVDAGIGDGTTSEGTDAGLFYQPLDPVTDLEKVLQLVAPFIYQLATGEFVTLQVLTNTLEALGASFPIAVQNDEPDPKLPLWYDSTAGVERLMVLVNGIYEEATVS